MLQKAKKEIAPMVNLISQLSNLLHSIIIKRIIVIRVDVNKKHSICYESSRNKSILINNNYQKTNYDHKVNASLSNQLYLKPPKNISLEIIKKSRNSNQTDAFLFNQVKTQQIKYGHSKLKN